MIGRTTVSRITPSKQVNACPRHVFHPGYLRMSKLFLMSVAVLSVAGSAGALTLGPLNCTPFPTTFAGGIGGPNTVSCPPFTVAGATLNAVTLIYAADYQFGTNAANTIQITFTPAGPAGVTWALPSTVLSVSGGTSSGASGMGGATATTGVTAANFAAAFNVNLTAQVTVGGVATSAGAVSVTYDYTGAVIPPPPPPGAVCSASAAPVFAPGVPNAYMVRYASNLSVGDSVINLTNTGAASTVAFPIQDGNINANVYVFSPDEQLISCCCCPITPDGLASLSVQNDLISNTLTPGVPTSVVVKVVATLAPAGTLTDGLGAWGTSLHALPVTPGTPATTFGTTETTFTPATLSAAELTRITTLCGLIQTNGSGFGICKSCRLGGLGASKK